MKTKFFTSIILFALGIVSNAQTSKESANTSILNEFANKLDNYNIYVHHSALDANDTIYLEDGTFIINPFQSAWCYFIDEMPSAGWGHPCKYYFVDQNNNRHVVFDKDIYPANHIDFESVSIVNRETSGKHHLTILSIQENSLKNNSKNCISCTILLLNN